MADRNHFIVVLPHQESRHHPNRCWRWYEAAHQHRGRGEPAQLAAIVSAVAAERQQWRADPRRVYVAGLSAGGAMALTLAATYPDLVAAVGVHSAPAYRSATRGVDALRAMAARTPVPPPSSGTTPMAPLIVLQGDGDRVVHPHNGDRVVEQWLAHRAEELEPRSARIARSSTITGTTDGRSYTRRRWYATSGRRVLELWRIAGLGHAWSGGRAGSSYSDPHGPRAATIMWSFFRTHSLAPS